MCLDDCIGIRDGFNLEVLVKSIPAPRSPGRPRKQPRMGQHDTTFTGHNAIPKLLTKRAAKSGFPINRNVLVPLVIENESGTSTRNFDGEVRSWFIRDGNYYSTGRLISRSRTLFENSYMF